MPPVPVYRGPSIFQEVSFQHDTQMLEVFGGPAQRIMGAAHCEITLRLPADAELGAVIHNYDVSDADKLRMIAAHIEEPLAVRSPAPEPEPEELNPVSTGVRDWEV